MQTFSDLVMASCGPADPAGGHGPPWASMGPAVAATPATQLVVVLASSLRLWVTELVEPAFAQRRPASLCRPMPRSRCRHWGFERGMTIPGMCASAYFAFACSAWRLALRCGAMAEPCPAMDKSQILLRRSFFWRYKADLRVFVSPSRRCAGLLSMCAARVTRSPPACP